jgi:hypothetical protein
MPARHLASGGTTAAGHATAFRPVSNDECNTWKNLTGVTIRAATLDTRVCHLGGQIEYNLQACMDEVRP